MHRDRPLTEENTPDDDGETIHIPRAFLQGTQFKAGDELVLKVVSQDEDGLEVAYAKAPESEEEEKPAGREKANAELDQLEQDSNSEY